VARRDEPSRRARVPHGLREEHALLGAQMELAGERGPVAVVEPGGEALRGGEEVDIARDEAGVDEVVRPLDLGILEARLLEAGRVRDPVDVGDIDELDQGRGVDAPLAGVRARERRSPAATGTTRSRLARR